MSAFTAHGTVWQLANGPYLEEVKLIMIHATPAAFAPTFTPQRGLTLRNPQGSASAPVAQPAQMGKTQTRSLAHAG